MGPRKPMIALLMKLESWMRHPRCAGSGASKGRTRIFYKMVKNFIGKWLDQSLSLPQLSFPLLLSWDAGNKSSLLLSKNQSRKQWYVLPIKHTAKPSFSPPFVQCSIRVKWVSFGVFFNFFFFYWSIADLRCCVTFCCTAKWISYIYTYTHSF